jgi:hypothetical protein
MTAPVEWSGGHDGIARAVERQLSQAAQIDAVPSVGISGI